MTAHPRFLGIESGPMWVLKPAVMVVVAELVVGVGMWLGW